jgi:hypothetical protein
VVTAAALTPWRPARPKRAGRAGSWAAKGCHRSPANAARPTLTRLPVRRIIGAEQHLRERERACGQRRTAFWRAPPRTASARQGSQGTPRSLTISWALLPSLHSRAAAGTGYGGCPLLTPRQPVFTTHTSSSSASPPIPYFPSCPTTPRQSPRPLRRCRARTSLHVTGTCAGSSTSPTWAWPSIHVSRRPAARRGAAGGKGCERQDEASAFK